jgi:hypothetical protein
MAGVHMKRRDCIIKQEARELSEARLVLFNPFSRTNSGVAHELL